MRKRSITRLLFLIGGFLVGLIVGYLVWGSLAPGTSQPANYNDSSLQTAEDGKLAEVKRVIDGDTIVLASGERVRLLGINSTEHGEACFTEAKQYLDKLVANEEIKLTSGTQDKDKYNRLLRWVWLGNENINIKMVAAGLAKAFVYSDDLEYKDSLIDAEAQARDELRGCLWQDGHVDENLPEIDYTQAPEFIGEKVKVSGVIDNVFKSGKGNIFINFCVDYKNCPFSAVIFATDAHRFSDLPDKSWIGREVMISGEVKEYKGQAEIIVSGPDQLILSQ